LLPEKSHRHIIFIYLSVHHNGCQSVVEAADDLQAFYGTSPSRQVHQLSQVLDLHYMHGSPKDKDYSKDMQLPFKSSGLFISVIANEYIPCHEQFSIPLPPTPVVSIRSVMQDHQELPDFLANIWQPPKYC